MLGRSAAVLAVALLTACASDQPDAEPTAAEGLRVASFDFVESEILTEVYAQALEAEGIEVERLGAVGPREVVVPAMRNDRVDLVPEYLGSALAFAGVTTSPADATTGLELLDAAVNRFDIDVLTPAPAEDTNVFVVTAANAVRHELAEVSDLTSVDFDRIGGPAECPERPLCLLGLDEVYDLTFVEFVTQPSLLFTAEALRRDEIDVGVMFSTSPELAGDDLVALRDDRGLQPLENVVPMIRRDALDRWDVGPALDAVSAALTTEGLRDLNRRAAEGEPIADIARAWLASID